MRPHLSTVGSPQGLEHATATKEVTSASQPAPDRPQENWHAVLDNCWGTFVLGDSLSISFIGTVLCDKTLKSSIEETAWMEFLEICCSACFCSPVVCMNVLKKEQQQYYAFTVPFALGAPSIFVAFLLLFPHLHPFQVSLLLVALLPIICKSLMVPKSKAEFIPISSTLLYIIKCGETQVDKF